MGFLKKEKRRLLPPLPIRELLRRGGAIKEYKGKK
jgi:hypothetical protein